MKAWHLVLLAGVSCAALPAHTTAQPQATYVHIALEGAINPVKARYVHRALERARTERARFVIVSINTPGGLVDSMEEITSAFVNSPVPIVGFVSPRSAQATSAGALILLATDIAAMAPGTRVGAAHPVGPGGGDLPSAMDDKATNTMVALAKSLAARRGRPSDFAESIVRKSMSLTAEEAKQRGAVEIIANSRTSLLRQLEGRTLTMNGRPVTLHTTGATAIEMPLSWAEQAMDLLADPTIASMLLSIGVLAILYELASPGIGMAGIVGIASLLTGLLGMSVLPIRVAAVLLLLVGLIAIAVEAKVNTHGLVGLGGVVAVFIGALLLVDEGDYFGAVQFLNWTVFLPFVVVLCGLFILAARAVGIAMRARPHMGIEALSGKRGRAKKRFETVGTSFEGIVLLDGARWQAVSDAPIEDGDVIEVTSVLREPTRLMVKRAHD